MKHKGYAKESKPKGGYNYQPKKDAAAGVASNVPNPGKKKK